MPQTIVRVVTEDEESPIITDLKSGRPDFNVEWVDPKTLEEHLKNTTETTSSSCHYVTNHIPSIHPLQQYVDEKINLGINCVLIVVRGSTSPRTISHIIPKDTASKKIFLGTRNKHPRHPGSFVR